MYAIAEAGGDHRAVQRRVGGERTGWTVWTEQVDVIRSDGEWVGGRSCDETDTMIGNAVAERRGGLVGHEDTSKTS